LAAEEFLLCSLAHRKSARCIGVSPIPISTTINTQLNKAYELADKCEICEGQRKERKKPFVSGLFHLQILREANYHEKKHQ